MTGSSPAAQQSTNKWVKGATWLLVALLGTGLIVFLNVRKPVWLVPPWLHYTPFAYAAMALGWVPVLAVALRRLAGRRWLLILVASVVLGQCVGCLFAQGLYVELIDLEAITNVTNTLWNRGATLSLSSKLLCLGGRLGHSHVPRSVGQSACRRAQQCRPEIYNCLKHT